MKNFAFEKSNKLHSPVLGQDQARYRYNRLIRYQNNDNHKAF